MARLAVFAYVIGGLVIPTFHVHDDAASHAHHAHPSAGISPEASQTHGHDSHCHASVAVGQADPTATTVSTSDPATSGDDAHLCVVCSFQSFGKTGSLASPQTLDATTLSLELQSQSDNLFAKCLLTAISPRGPPAAQRLS